MITKDTVQNYSKYDIFNQLEIEREKVKELMDVVGHSKILCDIIENELNRYFGVAHDAQIRLVLSNLKEILEQALNKE